MTPITTLLLSTVALAAPDLAVLDISAEPASPAAGEGAIHVALTNQGDSDVDLPFVDFTWYEVRLDGALCYEDWLWDLDAGETFHDVVDCPADTPGPHEVSVTIDSTDQVSESDESNNTATKTIVWSGPNLVIKSVDLLPAVPNIGEGELAIVFENTGAQDVDPGLFEFVNYTVALDGEPCDDGWIADLDVGETNLEVVTTCVAQEAGLHALTITIDSDQDVAEADEADNTLVKSLVWAGGPDLLVTAVAAPDWPLVAGQPGAFVATVGNVGTVEVVDSFVVRVFLDGTLCGEVIHDPPLAAGGQTLSEVTGCVADVPGDHLVRVEVDATDAVLELSAENNVLEESFLFCRQEVCDGIDNDCDGEVDEGLGLGGACDGADADECADGKLVCDIQAEAVVCLETAPGKVELCNEQDDDCDGLIDEDLPLRAECVMPGSWCAGALGCAPDGAMQCEPVAEGGAVTGLVEAGDATCSTGIGACRRTGSLSCGPLGLQCDAAPGAPEYGETCGDGLDDNCNGLVDEGCPCEPGTFVPCGTSLGTCSAGVMRCVDGNLKSFCEGSIAPVPEVCGDGADNDCDGSVDEGCGCDEGAARPCTPSSGACSGGLQLCLGGGWTPCLAGARAEESCNGIDDDCDGITDAGCDCDPGQVTFCAPPPQAECQTWTATCSGSRAWAACTPDPECTPETTPLTDPPDAGDATDPPSEGSTAPLGPPAADAGLTTQPPGCSAASWSGSPSPLLLLWLFAALAALRRRRYPTT